MAFDREFALVDSSGVAMRLHSYPKMSEIESSIDLESRVFTVSAPNHDDLILDLKCPNNSLSSEDVQVCGVLCKGNIWGGIKAARWFSSVLGVQCWLARYRDEVREETSQDFDERYAYCNEAPLLLVSDEAISQLNSVIIYQGRGRTVEARHFRPNVVVCQKKGENKDTSSNPEDSWQKIVIRGSTDVVELTAAGLCGRCQMVDVDPSSGMKGNTLRALAHYRRDRGKINFGTFFTGNPDASEGIAWLEEGSDVHYVVET